MAELIGVREAARRLDVHENSVRNWAKRGILPAAQRSGARKFLRFDPRAVEDLRVAMEADRPAQLPGWLSRLPAEAAREIDWVLIKAMTLNGEDPAERELFLLRRDWLRAEIVRKWSLRRKAAA